MTAANNVLLISEHRRSSDRGSVTTASEHDLAFAQAFLEASRPHGAEVIAVNERLLMATSTANALLGSLDQAALWHWAQTSYTPRSAVLPIDRHVHLETILRPVFDGAHRIGVLISLKVSEERVGTRVFPEHDERLLMTVIPGTSDIASEVRRNTARALRTNTDVLVTGEQGTGKLTVARRVVRIRSTEALPTCEFDARQADEGWVDRVTAAMDNGPVLVAHIDTLSVSHVAAIRSASHRNGGGRLVATSAKSNLRGWDSGGFAVLVPLVPLRDHLEDLPAIASEVLSQNPIGGKTKRLSAGVRRHLWQYPWPGNITELKNVLNRAAERAPTAVIDEACIRLPANTSARPGALRRSRVQAAELETLRDALVRCEGNKLAAADLLGISRSTLYRKVRALGL